MCTCMHAKVVLHLFSIMSLLTQGTREKLLGSQGDESPWNMVDGATGGEVRRQSRNTEVSEMNKSDYRVLGLPYVFFFHMDNTCY